jgi:hypothetical protein
MLRNAAAAATDEQATQSHYRRFVLEIVLRCDGGPSIFSYVCLESRIHMRLQEVPDLVALVVLDASDAPDAAVREACGAAAAAATSAGHNDACIAVLQHVLSGNDAAKRCTAALQLPCYTSRVHHKAGDVDIVGRVASAAAAAALSLSRAPASPLIHHPILTASLILSSAASRVGKAAIPRTSAAVLHVDALS